MVRFRTIWLPAATGALGLGLGLLLFTVCGQSAPVVVQFGGAGTAGNAIRVYVSGAVRQPGVYPMREGDRIVEAVTAAGGPAEDADTEAVNFAEPLRDGEHIHVPAIGELPITPAAGRADSGFELVDINRADVNLLLVLPGISAKRASNIVASRQKDGPFRRPEDLLERKLLTQAIYGDDI